MKKRPQHIFDQIEESQKVIDESQMEQENGDANNCHSITQDYLFIDTLFSGGEENKTQNKSQSNENQSSKKQQKIKSDPLSVIQSTQGKQPRCSNYLISNIIRNIINQIKKLLEVQNPALFFNFYYFKVQKSIQGGAWGYPTILGYFLFMRDKQILSSTLYNVMMINVSSMLKRMKAKKNNPQAKQVHDKFLQYLSTFQSQDATYEKNMKSALFQQFIYQMIQKRKSMVEDYVKKISKSLNSLEQSYQQHQEKTKEKQEEDNQMKKAFVQDHLKEKQQKKKNSKKKAH